MRFTSVLPFTALSVCVNALSIPNEARYNGEGHNDLGKRADLANPAFQTFQEWEQIANAIIASGVGVFGGGGPPGGAESGGYGMPGITGPYKREDTTDPASNSEKPS